VRDLGDKTTARALAERAGVPVIPGSGILPPGEQGRRAAAEFADRHGYPLMLKAVAGGATNRTNPNSKG
jgi:biotin carboxylase